MQGIKISGDAQRTTLTLCFLPHILTYTLISHYDLVSTQTNAHYTNVWLHNPPNQKSSMSKWQILANSLWCWPIGWPSANVKTMFKLWTMPSSVWLSQSHSYLESMSLELHQVTRETQTSLSSIVRMHVNKLKDVFFLHAGPIWPCQGCTEGAEHWLFFWAFLSSFSLSFLRFSEYRPHNSNIIYSYTDMPLTTCKWRCE